jgi:hypothetical protein
MATLEQLKRIYRLVDCIDPTMLNEWLAHMNGESIWIDDKYVENFIVALESKH